jgi:hypothetical protein
MTVFENAGRWDTSNVVFDRPSARVVVYDKQRTLRPSDEFRFIDYGLSAFRRSTIEREVPPDVRFDLSDVCRELSVRGELAGFEVAERFYEIGSPAGMAELERFLGAS